MKEVESKSVKGDLKSFSIFDITHTLMMSRKTALVTIERGGKKGFLYFEKGQIVSAIDDTLAVGEQAAFKIFFWRGGLFAIDFDVAPRERNIRLDTENLLLEIARNLDENERDDLIEDDGSDASAVVEEQFEDRFKRELTKVFDQVASNKSPARDRYTIHAFDELLVALNDLGGSALFLRPGGRPRIKTGTGFTTIKQDQIAKGEIEGFLTALLAPTEARHYAENREVSVYYSTDRAGTFQVHAFHDSGRAACIISPASRSIPPLGHLAPEAPQLGSLLRGQRGLHLIAGPLASGKTALFTALLEDSLRRHDYLITLFARTQRYQFGDDSGFLIRAELNRFHLGGDGLLQGAIDKGSDVIAVDEIDEAVTLRDACVVASRAGLVLATIEAESAENLVDRLREFALQPGGERLLERLGACLESLTFVDLGRERGQPGRIGHQVLDAEDRTRIARGELTPLLGPVPA
ncbi:MAG: DUF4388 domain-containing protein [Planctomycetes bacterium]|nr:DUF4388 domain-containing protein [Planctomycetota bacterium]